MTTAEETTTHKTTTRLTVNGVTLETDAGASGVHSGTSRFRRPTTLVEALEIMSDDPSVTVVAGSTDHGVGVNLKGERPADVIVIDGIPELRGITATDQYLDIGAAMTLTEIERTLGTRVPLLGQLLPQFASRLIRNSATIGGNLGTGSPIGDTPPALLALEATLVLTSVRGEREVALCNYFTGYRQSVRERDELITRIRIPLPLSPLTAFHKIAKRRFDGSYEVRRVDIVHDVGDSLSPLIDIGQIEGGFLQGLGWLTLEDLRWDDGSHPGDRGSGRLSTAGASTYKLPSFSELPGEFTVELLDKAHEEGAVYGSKAVGEPPLMLAFSVREALRQAVAAFGSTDGADDSRVASVVDLPSPATPEAVYWAIEKVRTSTLVDTVVGAP